VIPAATIDQYSQVFVVSPQQMQEMLATLSVLPSFYFAATLLVGEGSILHVSQTSLLEL